MGVAGSGKTTIAQMLSRKMEVPYLEADDFHPESNRLKMQSGIPLIDEDREPWLQMLHKEGRQYLRHGQSVVMACSALKKSYRDMLSKGIERQVTFVFLKGDFDLFYRRMEERSGHFMPASLLKSQFDALEEPQNAVVVCASKSPEEVVAQVCAVVGGA